MNKINFLSSKFSKKLFFIIAAISLPILIILSLDAGISGDEEIGVNRAERFHQYFQTFGKDKSVFTKSKLKLGHYYGSSADVISLFIHKILNLKNIYTTRHIFNVIIGWLIILLGSLIVKEIVGWNGAIITFIIMFFTPKLIGHSFNNLKDIPFAFTFVFTYYQMIRFIKQLPKIKYNYLLYIALGIAMSISVRVGGILLIPYLFIFVGFTVLYNHIFITKGPWDKHLKKYIIRIIGVLIVTSIVGYFGGLILWPFGLENPIKNPFIALKKMSAFQIGIYQLFEGEKIYSLELPWYYLIKTIFISTPVLILMGSVLCIILLYRFRHNYQHLIFIAFLLFTLFFPLLYIIYKKSNVYGGFRQILFAYPSLLMLAGIGWFEVWQFVKKKKISKFIYIAIFSLLAFFPIRHYIVNHPYEYVYFNKAFGGIKNAHGYYETDYYYHSMREGIEWILENEKNNGDTLTIFSNGNIRVHFKNKEKGKIKTGYSRYYERDTKDWDYYISVIKTVDPFQIRNKYWPPLTVVHTINVDGHPICAILKRSNKHDFYGYQAINNLDFNLAIEHYKKYLKVNPQSELVYGALSKVYLSLKDYRHSIKFADKSLAYYPNNILALYYKAQAQIALKKYKNALSIFNQILKIKKNIYQIYYHQAIALYELGKVNEALKALNTSIQFKHNYYDAYMLMGNILINYKQYKNAEKVYNRVLSFNKKDGMANLFLAYCYHFQGKNSIAESIINNFTPNYRNKNINIQKLYARIYIDKGRLNETKQILQKYKDVNNDSDLFVVRALFNIETGNKTDAIKNLKQTLKLDNKNYEAISLLKDLNKNTVQK